MEIRGNHLPVRGVSRWVRRDGERRLTGLVLVALALAVTEGQVNLIASQLGCTPDELTLVQVDAAVGSVRPWTSVKDVEVTGRGGTDLRVAFPVLEKRPPSVIVVLTDGETPWPDAAPRRSRVVVGLIGDENRQSWAAQEAKRAMPWADVIHITEGLH